MNPAAVLPLGLADWDTASSPVCVGARLVGQDAQSVALKNALQHKTFLLSPQAHFEIGAAAGEVARPPRPGDWVIAELAFDSAVSDWICHRLQLATAARHPSPTTRDASALRARARVTREIQQYFRGQNFLEVNTPSFGRCPGLDPHVHSLSAVTLGDRQEYLMTSPEFFMKRLLAEGLPRIYQIARSFRAEEWGRLHEPEFTLVEWYRTFEAVDSIMADTEQLLVATCRALRPGPPRLFAHRGADVVSVPVSPPFERITIREAFSQFAGIADAVDLAAADTPRYFQILVDRVDPALAALGRPVFLIEYPETQAPLARPSPKNDGTAERFELVCAGIELANGYGELTDAQEQRNRFARELSRRTSTGEPCYPLDEKFLSALETGIPPSAGVALGLERLLCLAAALPDIQSTLSFPLESH